MAISEEREEAEEAVGEAMGSVRSVMADDLRLHAPVSRGAEGAVRVR